MLLRLTELMFVEILRKHKQDMSADEVGWLAAQSMKTTDAPMKGIADRAGYESEAAFSRAFKRHFGLPPGEWRQRSLPG